MCRFPANIRFNKSWVMKKIYLGEQIEFVVYSSSTETYVLGTSHKADFKLPDNDEVHTEWRREGMSNETSQLTLRILVKDLIDRYFFVSSA